jgi:predicted PurR-regulated permease PerM
MAVQAAHPNWQRAIVVLAGSVVGALTIGAMYWAQAVFIPVALAIFFTFMLNPLVLWLQRRGLGRVFSVLTVVTASALVVLGMVWLLATQIAGLAAELPKHSDNIRAKVRTVRELLNAGSGLDKISDEIKTELTTPKTPEGKEGASAAPSPSRPVPVELQSSVPSWMTGIGGIAGSLLEGLAQFALAFILVVFMLLNREDMRDRIIRLAGKNQVTMTTKALDEAGQRISKFLLMQAIVNGTFGIAVSIGLLALRVEYAILWGFVGAVLRYVPYIGPWVAAVLPISVSIMMAEHWGTVLGVVGLFLVIELISNNVMEPLLYGQSMGVSEVALLVAAAFWAFLWGPIGLVLSAPLTVCMVVLGRYVPQLQFIDILMSDQPALDTDVRFYQRALARDPDEASELVLDRVKQDHGEQVFDELLIPALSYAKGDRERDYVSEEDETFLLKVVDDILTDLSTQTLVLASMTNPDGTARCDPSQEGGIAKAKFLACAARDRSDFMALSMLRQLLPSDRWDMEIMPLESLSSELVERAEETKPSLICIASLPPGGLSHTRYLCKRLKARHPDVKIIVGRWGITENVEHNRDLLREAGADWVSATLIETREQLCGWRPVIAAQTAVEEKAAAAGLPKLSAT